MDQKEEIEVFIRLGSVENTLKTGFDAQKKANEAQDEAYQDLDKRQTKQETFHITVLVWIKVLGFLWIGLTSLLAVISWFTRK